MADQWKLDSSNSLQQDHKINHHLIFLIYKPKPRVKKKIKLTMHWLIVCRDQNGIPHIFIKARLCGST